MECGQWIDVPESIDPKCKQEEKGDMSCQNSSGSWANDKGEKGEQ